MVVVVVKWESQVYTIVQMGEELDRIAGGKIEKILKKYKTAKNIAEQIFLAVVVVAALLLVKNVTTQN